ncbi:MAG: dihydrofolate reductase [Sphingomonadales bacterium]
MKISFVVAVAENGVIGRGGNLPWNIPADLQYFKRITMGHPIIMGRKTYESIGKPLPGRTNIIITRNRGYVAKGCKVATSLQGGYDISALETDEAMIIGGAEIFRMAIKDVDRLYLTIVHSNPEGDVIFPEYNCAQDFNEIWREDHVAEGESPAFSFVTLDRK